MDYNDLIALCEQRSAMYELLARVYRVEIDQKALAELRKLHFPQGTGSDRTDAAWLRLFMFLKYTDEMTLNDLAVDYARVFLGSGALDAAAAYPQESVYTSSHGLTMQEARDEVLAIYRSERMAKSEEWREAEDHLSCELEFLAEMGRRTAALLRKGDVDGAQGVLLTQYNFLVDHIANWVPRFCDDVPTYAQTDFYKAFSVITADFVEGDRLDLEDLLSDVLADQAAAAEQAADEETEEVENA